MLVKNESGFSLMEVLIATMILSFGLLGYAQSMVTAFHQNNEAYWRSLAAIKIQAMVEYLTASPVISIDPGVIQEWEQEVADQLPQGKAQVSNTQSAFKIKMDWNPHQQMIVDIHV